MRLTDTWEVEAGLNWFPDGQHLLFAEITDGRSEFIILNLSDSSRTQITHDQETRFAPKLSPDGKSIVYMVYQNPRSAIYIMDANGKNAHPVTDFSASDLSPFWSPDGKKILFSSTRNTNAELYARRNRDLYEIGTDGSNLRRVTFNSYGDTNFSWSRDGKKLLFDSIFRHSSDQLDQLRFAKSDIYEMDITGVNGAFTDHTDNVHRLTTAAWNCRTPVPSPVWSKSNSAQK
jgi:Tol biopolymer transport system component